MESKSGFEIVTQVANTGKWHLHICSLNISGRWQQFNKKMITWTSSIHFNFFLVVKKDVIESENEFKFSHNNLADMGKVWNFRSSRKEVLILPQIWKSPLHRLAPFFNAGFPTSPFTNKPTQILLHKNEPVVDHFSHRGAQSQSGNFKGVTFSQRIFNGTSDTSKNLLLKQKCNTDIFRSWIFFFNSKKKSFPQNRCMMFAADSYVEIFARPAADGWTMWEQLRSGIPRVLLGFCFTALYNFWTSPFFNSFILFADAQVGNYTHYIHKRSFIIKRRTAMF